MNDPKRYAQTNKLPQRDVSEILESYPFKWKEENARILDVGCGEGSLTMNILMKHIPKNFDKLVGSDVNRNSIEYAREHHSHHRSKKVQFIELDIENADISQDFKESFDHVFSSYAFHWVVQQEIAFSNIYKMLASGGNCLIIFLAHSGTHEVYRQLSYTPKWRADLKDINTKFMSPYHDSQDPAGEIRMMMERIGFKDINVEAIDKEYVYEGGVDHFKRLMRILNPFDSLEDRWDEFMDDCVQLDSDAGTFRYKLIIAYGAK